MASIIHYDRARRDRHRHLNIGNGGAPEGVLAAAALRCIGGQMQGRPCSINTEEKRARPSAWAFRTPVQRSISMEEIGKRATFCSPPPELTDGSLLAGRQVQGAIRLQTHTIVMRFLVPHGARDQGQAQDLGRSSLSLVEVSHVTGVSVP